MRFRILRVPKVWTVKTPCSSFCSVWNVLNFGVGHEFYGGEMCGWRTKVGSSHVICAQKQQGQWSSGILDAGMSWHLVTAISGKAWWGRHWRSIWLLKSITMIWWKTNSTSIHTACGKWLFGHIYACCGFKTICTLITFFAELQVLLLGKDIVFQKQRVVNSLCKTIHPWDGVIHFIFKRTSWHHQ